MNIVKLIFRKPKRGCRFCGLNFFGQFVCFIDLTRNQYLDFFSCNNPCRMRVKGETPDWNNCVLNLSNQQERT